VLEVEQRFFQNEKGGYWSFCYANTHTLSLSLSENTRFAVMSGSLAVMFWCFMQ